MNGKVEPPEGVSTPDFYMLMLDEQTNFRAHTEYFNRQPDTAYWQVIHLRMVGGGVMYAVVL